MCIINVCLIFLALCTSTRDCIGDQLCIQNLCQATCHSNSSCPDFQFCLNSICSREAQCQSDDECLGTHKCIVNGIGQSQCQRICDDASACGRNAECSAVSHEAICHCKTGFFGNPLIGCQKSECTSDNDCSSEKFCENNKCKIVCLAKNNCGPNSLCSAQNHAAVCQCQPGYTGDSRGSCKLIDFCAESPCAPGASCQNSRGSYKCICLQDTIGDPYKEGCRIPVECEKSQDCPNGAECIMNDGVPKCRGLFHL